MHLRDTKRCEYCTAYKFPTESLSACCKKGLVIPPTIPETYFTCYNKDDNNQKCGETFVKQQELKDHCDEKHGGNFVTEYECQLDYTLDIAAGLLTKDDDEIK